MRCATPTTIYAFTGTGTTRGTYSGLTVGGEVASCAASQYMLLTPAEFTQHTVSPFKLSLAEAGSISSAVLLIWALGFGIRMAVKAMKSDQQQPEEF